MELWGIYLTGDSHRDILQAGVKGRGQSWSQVEEVRGLSRGTEQGTLEERCPSLRGPAIQSHLLYQEVKQEPRLVIWSSALLSAASMVYQ